MADPQKSEVHDVTADASTSPTADADESTTVNVTGGGRSPHDKVIVPEVHLNDVEIVSDDSDNGGPIVIKSDDPDLQHVEAPIDPIPTERSPEIDPPVKK